MNKFLLVILSLLSVIVYGQKKEPVFITLSSKGGFLMAHRTQMAHLSHKNAYGFDLSLSKQYTKGYSAVKSGYPINGLTLEFRNFGYDEVLGKSFGINQFIAFPVWQSKNNFCLDLTMGTGIAYITNHYDKFTNPTNNAIGSNLNAKVVFKFGATKYYKKIQLGGGLEMSHFSNGNIKMPNLGLNNVSVFAKVGYNIGEHVVYGTDDSHIFTMELPPSSFIFELIGSVADVPPVPYNSHQYPVLATRFTFAKPLGKVWSYELSADLVYNESNLYRYKDSNYTKLDVPQFGLYAGMSFTYFKSQIIFGMGYYLRDKINPLGRIYNRVGYRYYFNDKWFGLFNIRANFGRADFFEFGVGYKFKR